MSSNGEDVARRECRDENDEPQSSRNDQHTRQYFSFGGLELQPGEGILGSETDFPAMGSHGGQGGVGAQGSRLREEVREFRGPEEGELQRKVVLVLLDQDRSDTRATDLTSNHIRVEVFPQRPRQFEQHKFKVTIQMTTHFRCIVAMQSQTDGSNIVGEPVHIGNLNMQVDLLGTAIVDFTAAQLLAVLLERKIQEHDHGITCVG